MTEPIELRELLALLCSSGGVSGVALIDRGLVECAEVRPMPLGGWGKDPMLIVFRRVLPGGSAAGAWLSVEIVGTAGVELEGILGFGRAGKADEETARPGVADGRKEPPESRFDSELIELTESFRVFAIGREGRGVFGGPREGREGLGRVVAIVPPKDF